MRHLIQTRTRTRIARPIIVTRLADVLSEKDALEWGSFSLQRSVLFIYETMHQLMEIEVQREENML